VVISGAAVREAALMVGMYDEKDVDALKLRLKTLEDDLAQARESLDNLIELNELTKKVTA
jgi:hypothetical protein